MGSCRVGFRPGLCRSPAPARRRASRAWQDGLAAWASHWAGCQGAMVGRRALVVVGARSRRGHGTWAVAWVGRRRAWPSCVTGRRVAGQMVLLTPVSGIRGHLWRLCRTSPWPLKSLELSTHTVHKLNTRMGIPTSSWACSTSSWAAPAQRTGTDLPATLVCLQLGILHQQLGLLGRLPAGLALERPVWSSHCLDTWLLLRLRSCTRTALAKGWTDGRAGRAGRTHSMDVIWTVHVPIFELGHPPWTDIR